MQDQSQGWIARMFPTPGTLHEAETALNSIGKGFYWLGIITAGLGVFLGATMILDGFIYVCLGWALKRYRSRGVAAVLAAISAVGIVMTAQNRFAGGNGGRNIVLAIIAAAWALYACKVTIIYHRMIGSQVNPANVVIKSALAAVYAIVAFIGSMIVGIILGVDVENMSDTAGSVIAGVSALVIGAAFVGVLPFTRNRPVTSVTSDLKAG
jgi:hypothetical protein